jgi:hypothetical protein
MSNTNRDQFTAAATEALLRACGPNLLTLSTDALERASGEIAQAAGVMADAMVAASGGTGAPSDPPDAPDGKA